MLFTATTVREVTNYGQIVEHLLKSAIAAAYRDKGLPGSSTGGAQNGNAVSSQENSMKEVLNKIFAASNQQVQKSMAIE